MKTKDELRRAIRVIRAGMTLDWINKQSRAAVEHLMTLPTLNQAQHIACYLSKPFEIQTQRFIEACLSQGKQVCVPRHIDDHSGYAWSWVTPAAAWRDGPWRIAEPAHYDPVDIATIELAIVPAVAVDRRGNRLGHGGGNFDRLLAGMACPHAALVFTFQVVEAVPAETHDVPVQIIVTETDVHTIDA